MRSTIVRLDNNMNGEVYKDFLDRYYVPLMDEASILQQDNALVIRFRTLKKLEEKGFAINPDWPLYCLIST